LNYWSGLIHQGTPRNEVARRIWESAEHRGLQVDRYYAIYLHRSADPFGRAAWIRAFQGGASEIDVQRAIVTSGEYQVAHGSNAGFLTGLYVDILGRTPDSRGHANWLRQLNSGVSRARVAQAFLTSTEAYRLALNRYYEDYLHRPADESGARNWVNALVANRTTLEAAGVGFLASEEFRNRQRRRIGT
jgi:hypothetical protein